MGHRDRTAGIPPSEPSGVGRSSDPALLRMTGQSELIQFGQRAESLRGVGGSGLSDSLAESVLFRPYAGELFNLLVRAELQGYVAPLDGLGICLWVNDRKSVEDCVMVDALIALRDVHIFGVRITCRAEPGLVIEAGGFNHKCVVSLPMADCMSVPRWIHIFGQGSPVGPDGAPFVFALEELQHTARSINKLSWRGHEHDARETDGIALQNRVISAGAGSRSVSRDLFVELRLRPRCHGRYVLLFNKAFGTAGALILPDSRKVTFRSRRRRGLR